MRHVFGDCTNGLDISHSFDDNWLFSIQFIEFLTTNRAHTFDNWAISGIADNGAGLWRVTTSTANDLTTGEQIWIYPGASGVRNAGGLWTVTVIDSTHFDLQGSNSGAVNVTGNTTSGLAYIPVPSTANIAVGMNLSGAGIPAGATVGAVWTTPPAISIAQCISPVGCPDTATATATGVALTLTSNPYASGGYAFYDGTWRTGVGFAIGQADGTMCNQCFAFGYNTGFNFRGAVGVSFINAQYDQVAGLGGPILTPHLNNQNNTSVSVEFTNGSYGNIFTSSLVTFSGVGLLHQGPAVYQGNVVEVARFGTTSGWSSYLENVSGSLIFKNAQGVAGGQLLLNNNAQPPIFIANRLPVAQLYASATDAPQFYSRSVFGGNIDQISPSNITAQRFITAATKSPSVDIFTANAATDEKYWRWLGGGAPNDTLCLQAAKDDYSVAYNILCATRLASATTGVTITPTGATLAALTVASTNSLSLPNGGGSLKLMNTYPGAMAPSKTFAISNAGALHISNDAANADAAVLTDDGQLQTAGAISAPSYKVSGVAGFNGTKTAGSCVLTISGGIITNVTGC
jgi:hypothetical protein